MNNTSFKINWLNIILIKEFQNYLELELLKELSLVSKIVRARSMPKLFSYIQLFDYDFSYKFNDNIFIEYFNSTEISVLYREASKEVKEFRKALSIENGLKDIDFIFKNIKKFVKRFYLAYMGKAGYYIFPLVYKFENLTTLILRSCIIPYNGFYNMRETLPNLKHVELTFVTLSKLSNKPISSNELSFPPNLSYLEFYHCNIFNTDLLSDPYEFLFNKEAINITRNSFSLPAILAPNLKSFVLFGNNALEGSTEAFLDINPGLESFKIENYSLNLNKYLNKVKNLEIDSIISFNNTDVYPTLNNIKKLVINFEKLDYYEDIKKFALLCPNLEELHFKNTLCDSFQASIDTFLAPTLKNLPHLKTLQLFITNHEVLDISNLSRIENLIILAPSTTLFNLNFENCNELRSIEFNVYSGDIHTEEFNGKFNSFDEWIFEFGENNIKGYNINY
ncbi:hypothetical protein CONCODRAFT_166743 [Conidiobolus coronatus NRRL 28638]|uniref:RNI-like protein n=1 Tax=Conidiobolus coronatus (strain ATCC 28846 / CBS 209.66 / NRRL 28638) TaxID=796925 RepID=A0A137NZD6_CONC2|nr:hypothetical protein CONCODRAFT_166743 [Conidiobolus coronatus NRRL 28638]|eukprot:KXN68200.1 hypothetical protein CONCODRAFT_166743 [Conidiobolus coronatus NRRL 28638]